MSQKVVEHPSRQSLPALALLARIRDLVGRAVLPRLEQLLTALDDDLFARAEAAASDTVQQQYFDAMRVLRFERDALGERFQAALAGPEPRTDRPDPEVAGTDFESRIAALSLLEDDALEQRLAVTTMSHRVERDLELELSLLSRRIERLLEDPDRSVPEDGLREPAWRPKQIAEAWSRALTPIELGADVRLVLFKHFEHLVLGELGPLYERMNQLLAQAGVLPDLSPADARRSALRGPGAPPAPRPRSPAGRPEAPPSPGGSGAPGHPEGARGGQGESSSGQPESAGDGGSAPASGHVGSRQSIGGPELGARALGGWLRSLPGLGRHRRYADAARGPAPAPTFLLELTQAAQGLWLADQGDADLDALPRRVDLGAVIARDAAARGHAGPAMRAEDEDVVNLVQLLFDRILRDANMPVPIRALLSRLQFPILRVALADARFLRNRAHPARQFLNILTRIGIGWVKAEERAQDRMYRALERAVDRVAFEFEGDLLLFASLTQQLRRAHRAELEAVRRASDRIVAQEQARIAAERARRLVERLVAHRVAAVSDPVVARFLSVDWQQVMLLTHQQEGPGSERWKRAFTVLRRLSGVAGGPDGEELLGAVAEGLARIGRAPDVAERNARALLERLERAPERIESPVTERVLPEPSMEPGIDRLPDRRAVDQANALAADDWIEIDFAGGRSARGRLAAVTEPPERCIFVNRRGVRVATLSRLEIAAGIEAGRIRRLATDQLFDAALESVIGALRAA